MTPDQGLEVILTVVAAGLGHDPALEVAEDNRIHAHTHDLIHDPEVALLLSQEDRDPHLFWTSVELQGKQPFSLCLPLYFDNIH